MRHRTLTTSCILAFAVVVIVFSFVYGPLRRTFVFPERATQVASSNDIKHHWEAVGVRGRIAVLLTRHLNAEQVGNVFQEDAYIQSAMHQGIVRTVFYVVPDRVWDEVVNENRFRNWISPHKPTTSGFAMLFEEGRVNVLSLSRFWPQADEKSLVVIEPGIWSSDDLAHIARLIASKSLRTDLLAVLRGSSSDFEFINSALSSSHD